MCGRYVLNASKDLLEQVAPFAEKAQADNYKASFNLAPSQKAPFVRLSSAGKEELVMARWGLIPSWAKDPSVGVRMINARAESVEEKPSFKAPFEQRRCLVLATGFYEWKAINSGSRAIKQPYYFFHEGNELMTFAGLWEVWTDPRPRPKASEDIGPAVVTSFTILTTEPNDLLADYHDRMPVIIAPKNRTKWLSPKTEKQHLLELCKPYPAGSMGAYPVSRNVNSPSQNSPANIEPMRI